MNTKEAIALISSKLIGLQTIPPEQLYLSHLINWGGYVEDTFVEYTELVIKHLYKERIIENYKINGIKEVTLDKSYYSNALKILLNQKEETSDVDFIKSLFIYNFYEKELGTPIDFYVPIDNDNSEKIDLVTFNKNTSEIFLVDVKPPNSDVTALRCCMEIQTYFQKLNKEKFINDLYEAGVIPTKHVRIRVGIIVFEGSEPFMDFIYRKNKYLKRLTKHFNLQVCIAGRRKDEILKEFKNDIEQTDRNYLHYNPLLFSSCRTSDTKELYDEVLAQDLLNNNFYLNQLNFDDEYDYSIEILNREKRYLYNNAHLVPELKNYVCFIEGKDYKVQKPRDVETTIMAYNPKTNEIYFIEEVFRPLGSALAECLAVQEYALQADHSKIVKHLHQQGKLPSNNYQDYTFKLGLAIYNGSETAQEFQDQSRVYLQEVIKQLDIKIIYIK